MLDWNDLRYFLAVAREGSTLAAGRALARQPDDGRAPDCSAEVALGVPVVREAPGRLRSDAARAGAACSSGQQVETCREVFADAAAAQARDVERTP